MLFGRSFGYQSLLVVVLLCAGLQANGQSTILLEAESFPDKGGWLVDQQFVEQMGSTYLLAHGLGRPVADGVAVFDVSKKGEYIAWVRTRNWAPGDWQAPGRFQLLIDGEPLPTELGTVGQEWAWQLAGSVKLKRGQHSLALRDLTGFDGRCDAIVLTTSSVPPPNDLEELTAWRAKVLQLPAAPTETKTYDLVITGGGLAGCAAAITAAEEGMSVALIHDRPVLGGNASGEIRVHTLGIYGHFERVLKMIDTEHYPNGDPKAYGEDDRRMANVSQYENIDLFLEWRAYDAHAVDSEIQYVDARHTNTGERLRFEAPLFADCTGDGWIGYWSGAEFMYGRESADQYDEGWEKHGEIWSPEIPDNFVMGSSVLWRSGKASQAVGFPEVPWALEVAEEFSARAGEWQWEFSRNDLHQIHDAEYIRDHMLKAIYGSFYNEKQKDGTDSLQLVWVSHLVGKRESRRLVGDHIYNFQDVRQQRRFPDSVVIEKRAVDVHYQQNLLEPHRPDFLSEALFFRGGKYIVPYRSLYSKNISNLFMAGRCFSCTHIGLGGPRVMRTTGQMGAAVGYAASICKKYSTTPRGVYTDHLKEYMNVVTTSNTRLRDGTP